MKKTSLIMAVLFSLVLMGCGGQRLSIYNWSYYTPPSVVEKFEEEFDVTVSFEEFASNEEMYTKLKAGGGKGYDIVFPSGDYAAIMIQEDMLEKIDKSQIPNLSNIDPAVLKKASHDTNMDYAVPYYYGAAGIVVNTARVPDFERSWSIFGREDLKDRMTMLDDMREVMGDALTYLGYSVNAKDPRQIEAAKNLINNSWKPNLTKFEADSFGINYARGDFWVVQGYAEVVFEEISGDPDLLKDTVFFIPPEGGPSYIDSMCILKGAKNLEMAHNFINFIHRPEIYAEFTDWFGFPATVNIPARKLKTGNSWYTLEDLENTELKEDLGDSLRLYTDVWFDSIKVD
ncbi:spermidine/putrescine ABC transporter substrate-binding protein [Spirochaetia bacterium]|nr:spermidine/putrescine ABC transporter substrate-binding protein [Spirochaetia bacterium]